MSFLEGSPAELASMGCHTQTPELTIQTIQLSSPAAEFRAWELSGSEKFQMINGLLAPKTATPAVFLILVNLADKVESEFCLNQGKAPSCSGTDRDSDLGHWLIFIKSRSAPGNPKPTVFLVGTKKDIDGADACLVGKEWASDWGETALKRVS